MSFFKSIGKAIGGAAKGIVKGAVAVGKVLPKVAGTALAVGGIAGQFIPGVGTIMGGLAGKIGGIVSKLGSKVSDATQGQVDLSGLQYQQGENPQGYVTRLVGQSQAILGGAVAGAGDVAGTGIQGTNGGFAWSKYSGILMAAAAGLGVYLITKHR